MQARHSAPEPQPVRGEEADVAPEPQPVRSEEVDAAAVALRQLDAIVQMPEPPRSKALERQNSAHVVEKLRERGDVSREEITEAMREETHTQASYGQLGGMMSGLLGPNTFRADYATTRVAGRSRCKKCRKMFHAGDVRVGAPYR